MKLRVATWNMDHWKRMRDDPTGASQRQAWDYLVSLGADIALVQEATPPPFLDPASWPVRSHPAADRPDHWFIDPVWHRWGSAVVVFNPWISFEPVESVPLGADAPRHARPLRGVRLRRLPGGRCRRRSRAAGRLPVRHGARLSARPDISPRRCLSVALG